MITFSGKVEHGRMILDEPERYFRHLCCLEGKRVFLTIKREKKPRSDIQNAYYFGVVIKILAEHFGYDEDEMHEALKHEFLSVVQDSGLTIVKSTSDLSTVEFEEYLEKIRRWAATKWETYIPNPNEVM